MIRWLEEMILMQLRDKQNNNTPISWQFKAPLKADLDGTILSHATSLQHESCRVNQTYNLLMIIVYNTKNVIGFWNMF